MMTANMDIRTRAENAGVRLWEIADKLKLRDSEFSRLMRREIDDAKKGLIFALIEEIKREHESRL